MTKIYTRTGYKGETSLFTGQRIRKNDSFIEALGAVDECNSAIGLAIAHLGHSPQLKEQLETVQHALFDAGAALATPRTTAQKGKIEKTRFDDEEIKALEDWIDNYNSDLPPLKAFILPGGHPTGAALHLARSLCRRAERAVVPLFDQNDVSANVLIYLNRLSDYLFVASRWINHALHCPETEWQKHKLTKTT